MTQEFLEVVLEAQKALACEQTSQYPMHPGKYCRECLARQEAEGAPRVAVNQWVGDIFYCYWHAE